MWTNHMNHFYNIFIALCHDYLALWSPFHFIGYKIAAWTSYFVFDGRKKIIQTWNDMRVSKG